MITSESHEEALQLWCSVTAAGVRSALPDLSARQTAILFTIYLDKPPHTVRALARSLNISKPAVSRALDRLGELGYVTRRRDDLDRRNVMTQMTERGEGYMRTFSSLINEVKSSPLTPSSATLKSLSHTSEAQLNQHI